MDVDNTEELSSRFKTNIYEKHRQSHFLEIVSFLWFQLAVFQ